MTDNIYKTLIDNFYDLVFLYQVKPENKFTYVSPSSIEINGYTPEEHYENPDLLYTLVFPDDKPLLEFIRENPQMVKKPIIIRWIRKDGRMIWTEQRFVNILDEAGGIKAIEAFIRDITEEKETEFALRESEKKFRELFHNINDSIFIYHYNRDEKIEKLLEVNETACKAFSYSREHYFTLSLDTLIEEPYREIFYENLEKLDEKKRAIFESSIIDYTGKKIPVEINAHYCRLNNQNVIIIIIRDITERKKIADSVLKKQKLESISILAGGIAHDFNNILSAILGNISLAKLNLSHNNDLYEILIDSENAIQRAKHLTSQLLTFSKGGEPVKKPLNLELLLKSTSMALLKKSRKKVSIEAKEEIWPVHADEEQIRQVIVNIITNAMEFTPDDGSIVIKIENIKNKNDIFLPLPNRDYVKFSVKDNGKGISKENLHRIFDPFFTTKELGSGLGLAAVYSIIKKHQGYISVESELQHGALFNIFLPTYKKGKFNKLSIPDQEDFHKEKNVLLMDDDDDVRFVTGKLLKKMGFAVEYAKDGVEAIKIYKKRMLESNSFDLVIMDLTVANGMGGDRAIEELKKIDPEIIAIISSGYFNNPVIANYKDYGFKGYISKPYTLDELQKKIQELI